MRDLVAGIVALGAAARRRQPRDHAAVLSAAAAARARLRAGARPDDHRRDPDRRRPRAVLARTRSRFYYGDRSIDKDLIAAVRVLINGAPIAAVRVARATRRRRRRVSRPASKIGRKASRAIGGTSPSKPSTGTVLVECGAIRERVSQELARAVFDAVKRDIETRRRCADEWMESVVRARQRYHSVSARRRDVDDARHHEQQIGQPVDVAHQDRVDGRVERDHPPLGAAADGRAPRAARRRPARRRPG